MPSKATENLKAARDLLSDPRKWTGGTFARKRQRMRDANVLCEEGYKAAANLGNSMSVVAWDSPEATCWCAMGALCKVSNTPYPAQVSKEYAERFNVNYRTAEAIEGYSFLALAAQPMNPPGLNTPDNINDDKGYKKTLEMFDNAIKLSEAQDATLQTDEQP